MDRNAVEIEIERDACMGAGECIFGAPAVFSSDEEGKSVVVDPRAAPLEVLLDAARRCPNFAISVFVDGGRRV